MDHHVSRRSLLKGSAMLGVGAALGGGTGLIVPDSALALAAPQAGKPGRALRIVHMTDMHIQPEKGANEGVTACLRHVAAQKDRPELILTGGDLIMDSFAEPAPRAEALWKLFTQVFKDHCPIPVEHTLGNHDIFGWNKAESKTTGTEPTWGKKWAMEVLGLSKPYRSFDRNGWHFTVLDSVRTDGGDGYFAKLEDEQMEWLKGDLAAVPAGTPVLVCSHIPILTLTVLGRDQLNKDNKIDLSPGSQHVDCFDLHTLFRESGKVKLVLSGHIHRLDDCTLDGVRYICDGAVSGAWWGGKKDRCDEGYGLIDLNTDGSVQHQYVPYGWKARS